MATLTLKIECQCGTRYKFDVEPVDGRMPMEVFCPHCGADGTDEANRQIEDQMGKKSGTPKVEVPKPFKAEVAKPVLKMPGTRPPQNTVTLPPEVHKVGLGNPCSRHPKETTVNSCISCKRPICPICMSKYGYFCSTACRHDAEQRGREIPVYEGQESVIQERKSRRLKRIVLGVVALLVAVCVLWVWYSFFGSKPSIASSAKIDYADHVEYCKFVGPDQVLLKSDRSLTLFDSHGLKVLWTTSLAPYETPIPTEEDLETFVKAAKEGKNLKDNPLAGLANHALPEEDAFLGRFSNLAHSSGVTPVQVHGGDIWVMFSDSLVVFDRKTGKEKKKVALHGQILQLTAGDSVIFATSTGKPNEGQFTRVSFRTGDVVTDKVTIPEPKRWVGTGRAGAVRDDSTALLGGMAGMMEAGLVAGTQQEVDLDVDTHQLRFIPAGVNVARLEIDLIEKNVTSRQVVKPEDLKPKEELGQNGPVKVTDAMALAKQMQYEAVQAKGGIYERSDESRYRVTLKRHLEDGAPAWTGEVIGPPEFCPLKTVDALVSSKSLQVFDKENEKLWESPLAFPAASVSVSFGEGERGPCFESGNTLYLYDSQALTSFELVSGKVRWRMPQAGVESVRVDVDGMLYITNADSVCKVHPETGKVLWKLDKKEVEFFLSNKYVYLSKRQISGADIIQSMGTGMDVPTHFRIFRVDPKTGLILWEYYQPKAPSIMDFQANRILLLYTDLSVKDMQTHSGRRPIPSELQILKYLPF